MEYSLPNSVVALLHEEKASVTPKAYFISSGKKSIKITLVYAKDQQQRAVASVSNEASHRKKSRHNPTVKSSKKSSTPGRKQTPLHHNQTSLSAATLHQQDSQSRTSSSSLSEAEQGSSTPEFNMNVCSDRRDQMSTVDSGHPSSSHRSSSVTGTHHDEIVSVSGSEVNDEVSDHDGESQCSTDSEKPRTPGREITAPESSFGPGETPVASREEMWQTWTRIPRPQIPHRNPSFLTAQAQAANIQRRSASPCVRARPRSTGINGDRGMPVPTQRRSRIQEPPRWDDQDNL